MARTLRNIERQIMQSIRQRYADPEVEIPLALQDRPTQIVFTGLEPKKRNDQRQSMPMTAMMGALGGGAGPMPGLPELMGEGGNAAPAAQPQPQAQPQQQAQGNPMAAMLGMDDERQGR